MHGAGCSRSGGSTVILRGHKHGSRWLRRDCPRPTPGTSPLSCCTVSCPPVAVLLGGTWLPVGRARFVACPMRPYYTSLPDVPTLIMSSILSAHYFDLCRHRYHLGFRCYRLSSAVRSFAVHLSPLSCGLSRSASGRTGETHRRMV